MRNPYQSAFLQLIDLKLGYCENKFFNLIANISANTHVVSHFFGSVQHKDKITNSITSDKLISSHPLKILVNHNWRMFEYKIVWRNLQENGNLYSKPWRFFMPAKKESYTQVGFYSIFEEQLSHSHSLYILANKND